MSEPRTITLRTFDQGDVTLSCPEWCVGHAHHDPESARADILHKGPDVNLAFHGTEVIAACLAQSPYATPGDPALGGQTIGVSVYPPGRTMTPVQLYSLAAALDGYADRLRDLADQLHALLGGGQ
ncbi:DUF6907 domain-containing protein [Streptomyces turgidiscabies]|uniref:DUF6907 domain-containing protein n=1 Tax=Streptomyces turgidiscabies TaxID=85558 RepID=UPI0038F6FB82